MFENCGREAAYSEFRRAPLMKRVFPPLPFENFLKIVMAYLNSFVTFPLPYEGAPASG